MAGSLNESADSVSDVRMGYLWPRWGKNQAWKDRLYKAAAHKSLDIPEDMNISNTKTGIGALGAVGIAAAAGIPSAIAAGILGYAMMGKPDVAANQPSHPSASEPGMSDYEILFYDKDGQPIRVDHISKKQK